MTQPKTKEEMDDIVKARTDAFRSIRAKALRNSGTLYLSLSGEGKVCFKSKDGIKQPFIQMRINPCPGTLYPDENDECCAKDQMFDFLRGLEITPLFDLPSNEKYVIDEAQWEESLNELSKEMEVSERTYWFILISCENETVISGQIVLLANEHVINTTMINLDYDFVTTIQNLDAPSGKGHAVAFSSSYWKFIVTDSSGNDHLISNENTDLFIRTIIPERGATLLYNKEINRYAVIDGNDYLYGV
ncbi:hypothetical protein [Aeromonas phage AerS_266]|nr:hypothetical protein [Aeromonas phage AerS_266]